LRDSKTFGRTELLVKLALTYALIFAQNFVNGNKALINISRDNFYFKIE
jgi:hypothetical protein